MPPDRRPPRDGPPRGDKPRTGQAPAGQPRKESPRGGQPRNAPQPRQNRGRDDRRRPPEPRFDPTTLLNELESAVRGLEKPLTALDYAAQIPHVETVTRVLKGLRLPNLDALELSMKGKVYTALLRAGRQTTVDADAAKEQARQKVHLALADLWKSVGDERREAIAFEAAGRTRKAAALLRETGEWDDVAALFEREGKFVEAARLFESHRAHADAARCFRSAKDLRSVVRNLHKAGDVAAVRTTAREMELTDAVETLLHVGAPALADELLTEKGEWVRLARLREDRRDFARAAEAREEADDLDKAAVDWRRARKEEMAVAIAERVAAPLLEKGDKFGAAEVFARFKCFGRAAQLVMPERPERAHSWYSKGGMDAEALALAQKEARKAAGAHQPALAAVWHERSGDAALAAEAYEGLGRWSDALRLHEQLGQWAQAAECALKLDLLEKAGTFYRRAGMDAEAAKVEQRIRMAPPRAPGG